MTVDLHHPVLLVELFERVAVVFVHHRDPTSESITSPAFLTVDEHGILAIVGWHLDDVVVGFWFLTGRPAVPGFLAILIDCPFVALVTYEVRIGSTVPTAFTSAYRTGHMRKFYL